MVSVGPSGSILNITAPVAISKPANRGLVKTGQRRSSGTELFLSLAVLPVAIFKNWVRIVTLSTLAAYVDRSYLTGYLHRYGGIQSGC